MERKFEQNRDFLIIVSSKILVSYSLRCQICGGAVHV